VLLVQLLCAEQKAGILFPGKICEELSRGAASVIANSTIFFRPTLLEVRGEGYIRVAKR